MSKARQLIEALNNDSQSTDGTFKLSELTLNAKARWRKLEPTTRLNINYKSCNLSYSDRILDLFQQLFQGDINYKQFAKETRLSEREEGLLAEWLVRNNY